jgi:hypothetical protein
MSASGADVQDRTGDLVLTKDALCQLSYIGQLNADGGWRSAVRRWPESGHRAVPIEIRSPHSKNRNLERETGIEPATNSLEGCDSTTELLPPTRSTGVALRRASPPAHRNGAEPLKTRAEHLTANLPLARHPTVGPPSDARSPSTRAEEGWWRGKDSNLRSH